jgi:selenide,water dikinase
MGGRPLTALAIATLPPAAEAILEDELYQMLCGGRAVLEAAGARLVGGHSAEGGEIALGFAVTGTAEPGRLLRKRGLRPGDRLILTKPLGTGALLAAEMRGLGKARWTEAALETMLLPAAAAAACLAEHGATACTDVTGFGLLGHLLEMLSASRMDARLDPERIPALDGALALLSGGLTSSMHQGNLGALTALSSEEIARDPAFANLLIDPQTAGGLLAGVPAEAAASCLAELRRLGYRVAEIGVVVAASGERPRVFLAPGCVPARPAPLPAAAEG